MRLIIPIILIALMLPYATSEDEPSDDWLIPPDPTMGVVAGTVNAAGANPQPATRPATQPAVSACIAPAPRR